MALQEHQVKDIIATALTKSWDDDSFKNELLVTPIGAIEKLTGERLVINLGFKIPVFEPNSFEFPCKSNKDFANFLKAYL